MSAKPTFIATPPAPASDSHSLVRTRSYRIDRQRVVAILESIFVHVRSERTTGTIHIDVSSGTPVMIRVEESQRIGPVKLSDNLPL